MGCGKPRHGRQHRRRAFWMVGRAAHPVVPIASLASTGPGSLNVRGGRADEASDASQNHTLP